VPAEQLGAGTNVRVQICGSMADVAREMASAMFAELRQGAENKRPATLIVPVGPVDQFPLLAEMINLHQLPCRDAVLINMDEYLGQDDRWIDAEHPLSFRGYMQRKFYDLVDPQFAPAMENRMFPDPADPQAIQKLIDQRGGVDACFGGIGINGHIAFNEPPEPGESMSADEFAQLPTRNLNLSRETRTINAVTVGGDIDLIPRRAVTIGMKECLAARRMRFYCNRPWQAGVVRRALHGPVTATCPASLLQRHPDAAIGVADYVAAVPNVSLR
jgi:glucosamine-6-phosphate deaminase